MKPKEKEAWEKKIIKLVYLNEAKMVLEEIDIALKEERRRIFKKLHKIYETDYKNNNDFWEAVREALPTVDTSLARFCLKLRITRKEQKVKCSPNNI